MSGRKNSIAGHIVLNAGDASGNLISDIINIQNLDNICVTFKVVSGTFTGVYSIQMANTTLTPSSSDWYSLPVTQAVTASSPSPFTFDLNQQGSIWMRAIYTSTSGSGSLEVRVSGKMI